MVSDSPLAGRALRRLVDFISYWLHPVRGPFFLLASVGALLLLAQILPAMPASLRPYSRYKQWRAKAFFDDAIRAREAGDLQRSRLALSSALTLVPRYEAARIEFARSLVTEGRFAEAARQAELIGMQGPRFVHDMLFYTGDFDALLSYCMGKAAGNRDPGVWLNSALMIAHLASGSTRDKILRSLEEKPVAESGCMRAIVHAVAKDVPSTAQALRTVFAARDLTPSEAFLGIEILMQAGSADEAWLWTQRVRSRLSDFDARCAEYRIEATRNPQLARHLFGAFQATEMNETRWARLAGTVALAGGADDADLYARLLASSGTNPPPSLAVSTWALLLLHNREAAAADWDRAFRRHGGSPLPLLAGRGLASSDPAARVHAIRFLAEHTPLPREMIAGLLMR